MKSINKEIKMKSIILLTIVALSVSTYAKIKVTPLNELVQKSDHIVISKVVKVDMIHLKTGKIINDKNARTGPGIPHQIRLHLEVDASSYLKTNGEKKKRSMVIPLTTMRHLSLSSVLDYVGTKRILLLEGKEYKKVTSYSFLRDFNEKEKIQELIKK